MKKFLMILAALTIAAPVFAAETAAEGPKEFGVYSDKGARENHFIPSGWIGDYGDVKMVDQSTTNPQSGTTCVEFTYNAKKSQGNGWAGVYWQNPANNWGSKPNSGFDLSGMNKLTFWARGAKGGEVIQEFFVGGIGYEPKALYPDSLIKVAVGPVELTDTWQQYSINLSGRDLSYVIGGFGWVTNADVNPQGCTFYIDNVKFEKEEGLAPTAKQAQEMPFYVFADRSFSKNHFIPSGWMGDYGDLRIDTGSKENPYLGDTCLKITYSGQATQGARWAGMCWQHPANNWGNVDAGYDLSRATKLTFWARGEKGGERIEEFKIGGLMGEFSDSDSAVIGPVILNKDWTQYTIDLKGKDMSYIIGGFCWAANVDNNPNGAVFYLDEIKFE